MRVMSLRPSAISKLLALWFVVLSASPFTAPFQTWDLSPPPVGEAPFHESLAADKLSKDATTPMLAHHFVPLFVGFLKEGKSVAGTRRHRVLPTVLRL